jgi:hypothetical protein
VNKWLLKLFVILIGVWAAETAAFASTVQLVGAPGPGDTGFITGPYLLKDLSTGTIFPVICDDFTTDVSLGYTWNANVYTLANLSLLKFGVNDPGGLKPTNLLQEYQAAFYLADQLFALPNTQANTDTIDDLSYAIWGIFSSSARHASGYDQDAAQLANTALNMSFGSNQYFNRSIYTPNPFSASQEYLAPTPVPEPATIWFLGIGIPVVLLLARKNSRQFRVTTV